MQANTLNYSVQQQKRNKGLFVVFSFAISDSFTVTQRIAHAISSAASNATLAQIADIVAAQAKRDNAAKVANYTSYAMCKQLQKNSDTVA